mmetsp:Transcript_8150/g.20053  ORF Transcript_8150/g.20053 Transcript_8150/m.20053 type:complete len:272 (+) Transcript_8150:277-1092(+)
MFAWMVGWCHGLRKSGLLSERRNHFLGISGGSLCGAFLAADLDLSATSDVMAAGQEQSDRCRAGKQTLGDLVSNMMEDLFTEEVAARIMGGNNRLHVAVVRAPGGGVAGLSRAMGGAIALHGRFADRRDLIDAMRATTYLPYICGDYATMNYRGESVVDAGITGQMFVPASAPGLVNVNIFPPLECIPERENAAGRYVLRKYARWMNLARAPVHAHPYDAEGFHLGIFGRDDLAMRPIEKEEALFRHQLGQDAFRSWHENNKHCKKRKTPA